MKNITTIIASVFLALSMTACSTTETITLPTDAQDALIQLEDCIFSSNSNDERLIDSMRYFHQQVEREQTLNLEFVQNELYYCKTGEDLF